MYRVEIISGASRGRVGYFLYIFRQDHQGKTFILRQDTEEEITPERQTAEPTLYLPEQGMLKELVAAISNLGIRPDHQSFTEGKYEASQKHLEDMRRLVFEDKEVKI